MRARAPGLVLLCLTLVTFPALGDWQEVGVTDGIAISSRAVPGQSLPEFRGIGEIGGSIDAVLAVLDDVDRHTEWMYECVESRVLAREGDSVSYVYNRTNSPWPVSDRDVVLRSETRVVEPGKQLHIAFHAVEHPSQGEVRGVVRITTMEGHYRLWSVGPRATRVEYLQYTVFDLHDGSSRSAKRRQLGELLDRP